MNGVIEFQDVTVCYGGKKALDGLNLSVKKGEIFGFLGPNGAGKSTTIKSLLGLVRSSSGSILLHGLAPSDPRARRQVGYLPEETTYYRFLTPLELLGFYGQVFGLPRKLSRERAWSLLELTGIAGAARKPLSSLSKGMVQRVSLAQALMNEPETLILDEPTSGLDPLARMELRKLLTELKSKGCTIFFSSHELSEVELLCDSLAIVKAGRLVRQGTLKELLGGIGHEPLERFFLRTIGEGPSS